MLLHRLSIAVTRPALKMALTSRSTGPHGLRSHIYTCITFLLQHFTPLYKSGLERFSRIKQLSTSLFFSVNCLILFSFYIVSGYSIPSSLMPSLISGWCLGSFPRWLSYSSSVAISSASCRRTCRQCECGEP